MHCDISTTDSCARTWFRGDEYFAIKINANIYCDSEAFKELAMPKHIASGDGKHWGHDLLVTAIDHVTMDSPNEPHICLLSV